MGKLERAKIYVLDGDGTSGKKVDEAGIDVCFNPKEYSLEKSVSWDTEKHFSDAPQPEFTKPSPMTLSLTLQFDTYEDRVSVREKYVKHLEKLAMMRGTVKKETSPTPTEKKKFTPPVVLFVWGRFNFKGVLESISQKYTMFLADGTPVRAEVALKLRNVLEAAQDKDPVNSAGGQASRSYTVKDGDRLDGIAATELGDSSRWTEIAMENDIDDPTKLSVGQTLKIPS
jgi:nucleoid-associated protein YgaU